MKKSVAITAVLALHVAAIGILLAQPGCSSEPEKPKLGSATATTQEVPEKTVSSDLNDGSTTPEAFVAPEKVLPPEGSSDLRAAPTRPVWNMSPKSNEVVVEDKDVAPAPKQTAEVVAPANKSGVTYTVKKGDTLSKIARIHRITVSELIKENGIAMSSSLKIGQTLSIPENAEAISAPAPKVAEVKSAPQGEESEIYIVKRGDFLGKIAKQHGMSVATLKAINSLTNDNIKIGQKLTVAKGSAVKVESKKAVTAPAAIEEGEIIVVIKSGDTLGKIAMQNGVTSRSIMKRNGITDPRKLRVGQKIFVPSKKVKGETKSEKASTSLTKESAETPAKPTVVAPAQNLPAVAPDAETQASPASPDTVTAPVNTTPAVPENTTTAPVDENLTITDIG